jgi:RecA-family ATPase
MAIVLDDEEFIGFKINSTHKSVIYVSTEDLENETSNLLKKQADGIEPNKLKNLRFIFNSDNLKENLSSSLKRAPADLIIFDCFADTYLGDLKDTQKIREYLQSYQHIAQEHKCLLLFLHHTGKRTENLEPSKNNLLSGQGFEAKMRLVVELRKDLINPSRRHLCIVKGNYLPSTMKQASYVLNFSEENLKFSYTNERVSFEKLVKPDGDADFLRFKVAYELKKQGMKLEDIAKRMNIGSKGTISKLFSKASELGWDQTEPTAATEDDSSNLT